jgi:hypothetical protein
MPHITARSRTHSTAMNSLHVAFAPNYHRSGPAPAASRHGNATVTTLWTNADALVGHPSEAPPQ